MSEAIETLQTAQQRAMASRPKVGGFPYLAETLRRAGVTRNQWYLPSCQSLYVLEDGTVMTVGTPLVSGTVEVPLFDREALITALRRDQAGKVLSLSSYRRVGMLVWCATTWTLPRAQSATMERAVRSMWKHICSSRYSSVLKKTSY